MKNNSARLFAMENSKKLGNKISKNLNIPLIKINKTIFADGEILVQSSKTVRNKDCFVVASLCKPVNENIMELLLFIDSLKRATAKSITTIITYYGYARQDRKAKGRQPIGAKLIADLLTTAGVTKVITIDLHNPAIQGFFDIALDDIKAQYIIAPVIKKIGKFTVVSPDYGGTVRARILAELISPQVKIAIVDKRRTGPNKSLAGGVLGNVKNKNVVIVDDMIDTGGTIIKAAKLLKREGAKKIIVASSHGLFSNGFETFDNEKDIDQVIVTDSIPSVYNIKSKKLKIISVAEFLSKTIKATINEQSVSTIYNSIRKKV